MLFHLSPVTFPHHLKTCLDMHFMEKDILEVNYYVVVVLSRIRNIYLKSLRTQSILKFCHLSSKSFSFLLLSACSTKDSDSDYTLTLNLTAIQSHSHHNRSHIVFIDLLEKLVDLSYGIFHILDLTACVMIYFNLFYTTYFF